MFIGYSLLLGEVLKAEELDYDLTTDFQVVCPCCKESVLKVERGNGSGSTTHFLRHRPIPGDAEAAIRHKACELRVASLSRSDVDRIRAEGRGQSLEAFLQVMDERLRRFVDLVSLNDPDGASQRPSSLLDDILGNTRLMHFLRTSPSALPADIRKGCWGAFKDVAQHKKVLSGLYGIDLPLAIVADSIRFGGDLAAHLATPQARRNRDLLLAASAACVAMQALKRLRFPVGSDVPNLSGDLRSLELSSHVVSQLRIGVHDEKLAAAAWIFPMVIGRSPAAVAREQRMVVRADFDATGYKGRFTADSFERVFRQGVAGYILETSLSLLTTLTLADHIYASRLRALAARAAAPAPNALPLASTGSWAMGNTAAGLLLRENEAEREVIGVNVAPRLFR